MERHDTLLIAYGSHQSRLHLRSVLQKRFNLLEATNTPQMLLLLEQNLDCIASVIVDISNWDAVDQELMSNTAAVQLLKQLPVIVVADKESYHDLTLYFRYGAADVIPLNYDPYAMLHRIETITQLTLHRKHLESVVAEQTENLRRFSDNMVDALSAIVESRNAESGRHILRIRNFTRILLEEVMLHCPEYGLTDRLVSIISSASALHDVGKIGIPDAVLLKPGELTREEREIMKTHSVIGCEMLNYLRSTVDQEYLKYAYNICRYHHERWDGQGYPDGLRENDIPICAQVVGLADCYDALTSKRAYKDAHSHTKAVNIILSGECGTFSPNLIECFKNVAYRFDQLSTEYADGRNPGEAIADMSLPPPSEESDNLLEKTWAKYYCMVHYLNAFLVEVQLDTGLFQVIYNPYPELAHIQVAHTFQELADIVVDHIVVPEEREELARVFREDIPSFIEQDLRRQTLYFHHRAYDEMPSGPFEMTFLRIGGQTNRRPSLAILCRKTGPIPGPALQDGSLMTNLTECTYVCRNDNGFTLVRPGKDTHSLGGYTPDEVMELFGGRLLDMAFPEERAAIRAEFDRQLKMGSVVRTEYRFLRKDGSVGWVNNKSHLVLGQDGQEYIQTYLFDITDTKTAHQRLQHQLDHYQTILAQTEIILFDLDTISDRIEFSDTWATVFGYAPSTEPLSQQFSGGTHVHPDDISLLLNRLETMKNGINSASVEIRIATARGRYLWCQVQASANRDKTGRLVRVLGMILNIDLKKQAMQNLEDRANRDSLTQLLNKRAAQQQIEQYLARNHQNLQCALLLLDLDNFKDVNDRYGHLMGDAIISQVARILTSLFYSQDIVARIGGDEFMILVQGVTSQHLLANQCHRLRDLLLHAFRSEKQDLKLGCSIGIALCPEHGSNYFTLFSKADKALYQAKARGKNDFCFYSEDSSIGYLPTSHTSTPIDSDRNAAFLQNDINEHILQLLCQSSGDAAAINQVLAIMGRLSNVSRVYVFENSEDDTYCINTFEWCNEGVEPQLQNLQRINYTADIPDYQSAYNEGLVFYCHDIRELPQSLYNIVEPQGIQSMLHCAIRRGDHFKGFVGFDECRTQRLWTKDEIRVLTIFSQILSIFLLRYREQEKQWVQPLSSLLETREQWTYLLEPNSYRLQATDPELPNPPENQLCYQALMGQNAPCQGCPLAGLSGKSSHWTVMEDPRDHSQLLAEAAPVTRTDGDFCRITIRRLSDHTTT